MKTIPALLLALTSFAFGQVPLDPIAPATPAEATKLDGYWTRHEGQRMGVKHYKAGRMSVSYLDRPTNIITNHMVGGFKLENSKSTEFPKFTTANWPGLRIPSKSFQISFSGDDIFGQTASNSSKEVWNRAAAGAGGKSLDDVTDFSSDVTDLDGFWAIRNTPKRVAIKTFDHGRIFTTQLDLETRDVVNHSIGIFSLKDGIMKERILYATEKWKGIIGTTFLWKMEIAQDSFTQTGPAGKQRETWSKIKLKP